MKLCSSCRNLPAVFDCGLCTKPLCKECEEFLEPNTFSFREKVSTDLTLGHYCANCFETSVAPELEKFKKTLEEARLVYIFFEHNPKPRTLIKRSNKGITVNNCLDREETFLRLGFRAAEKGYNAVIEAEVGRTRPRKLWDGKGIPALIDAAKQERFED